MRRRLHRFFREDEAATAVEYAVVLALILMTAFAAISVFGSAVGNTMTSNNNNLKTYNFGS